MKFSPEMIGQAIDIVQNFIDNMFGLETFTIDGKYYDNLASTFEQYLKEWTPETIKSIAVDKGYLYDWYQNSLANPDSPPVWTDEHIEEVSNDFYLIPKETIDGKDEE